MADTSTTVPRETLEQVAAGFRELQELSARKGGIQAQLIRWCVHKLRSQASPFATAKERREHRREQTLALIYLEWLATRLEGSEAPAPLELPVR